MTTTDVNAEPVRPAVQPRSRSRVTRWFAVGAAALAVLFVAELGVRLIDSRLPEPLLWHSFEAQKKVRQMDELAEAGGADVVFAGTSMMNVAVDPALLHHELGAGVVAYNASLASGIPRMTVPWLLDVVVPRLHPKLIVLGVTTYEFADFGDGPNPIMNAFFSAPAAERAMGEPGLLDDSDRWLRDHFAIWAHRFELRFPRFVLSALQGDRPVEPTEPAHLTETGYQSYGNHLEFMDRVGLDVSRWSLGTDDPAAIERLIESADEQRIEVVLVDMPVTDEYIAQHPHPAADFETYLAALRELAQRTGTQVIEMHQLRDHALFADRIHLNRHGTESFVPALVAELRARGFVETISGG